MTDYSNLTETEYNSILEELTANEGAVALLSIPGVYDAVSKYFHDAVLHEWERRQTAEKRRQVRQHRRQTRQSRASHDLFMAFADDAGNWSGHPLVGGNFDFAREDRGNLTHLKQAGLVSTFRDERGHVWLSFTEAGKRYAAAHGTDLSWI
jgi:hypothetical protein